MSDEDITITPAQRAYLKAFDHWLKTEWATGETGAATALKTACLNAILPEPEPLPTCTACGDTFVVQRRVGGRHERCYACSPVRYTALAFAA